MKIFSIALVVMNWLVSSTGSTTSTTARIRRKDNKKSFDIYSRKDGEFVVNRQKKQEIERTDIKLVLGDLDFEGKAAIAKSISSRVEERDISAKGSAKKTKFITECKTHLLSNDATSDNKISQVDSTNFLVGYSIEAGVCQGNPHDECTSLTYPQIDTILQLLIVWSICPFDPVNGEDTECIIELLAQGDEFGWILTGTLENLIFVSDEVHTYCRSLWDFASEFHGGIDRSPTKMPTPSPSQRIASSSNRPTFYKNVAPSQSPQPTSLSGISAVKGSVENVNSRWGLARVAALIFASIYVGGATYVFLGVHGRLYGKKKINVSRQLPAVQESFENVSSFSESFNLTNDDPEMAIEIQERSKLSRQYSSSMSSLALSEAKSSLKSLESLKIYVPQYAHMQMEPKQDTDSIIKDLKHEGTGDNSDKENYPNSETILGQDSSLNSATKKAMGLQNIEHKISPRRDCIVPTENRSKAKDGEQLNRLQFSPKSSLSTFARDCTSNSSSNQNTNTAKVEEQSTHTVKFADEGPATGTRGVLARPVTTTKHTLVPDEMLSYHRSISRTRRSNTSLLFPISSLQDCGSSTPTPSSTSSRGDIEQMMRCHEIQPGKSDSISPTANSNIITPETLTSNTQHQPHIGRLRNAYIAPATKRSHDERRTKMMARHGKKPSHPFFQTDSNPNSIIWHRGTRTSRQAQPPQWKPCAVRCQQGCNCRTRQGGI